MNLPIYKIVVNEEDSTGVEFISLVDRPAIEKDFLTFNNSQRFAVQSEEKRIITGAAMIADLPIYRFDAQRGEYYVLFDAATIWTIAKKFFRQGLYNSVNTDHSKEVDGGIHLIESYFVNKERGILPPKEFEGVTDGSWFVSYLVDNDDVWQKVKAGEWKGFSVEGFFDMDEITLSAQIVELRAIVDEFLQTVKKVNI